MFLYFLTLLRREEKGLEQQRGREEMEKGNY